MLQRIFAMAVGGVFCAWLLFHFAATLLYLTPLNPVKLALSGAINSYMQPYFAQNWHLFAPNPVDTSRVITVSCRLSQAQGQPVETEWYDVSTLLRRQFQSNRFSAAERLSRMQSSAMQMAFSSDELVVMLAKKRTDEDSEYNKALDALIAEDKRAQEGAQRVLYRIASWTCDQLHGVNATSATRVRIVTHRFPRFSKREEPDAAGELSSELLPWRPYERVLRDNDDARLSTEEVSK
jgi:hypothetical protein